MADGTSHSGAVHTNNSQSSKHSAPCRAGAGGKAIAIRTISRPKIIGAISPPPYAQSSPPEPDAEGAQSPPAAHRDDSLATNPSAGLVAEDHPSKRRRGGWGLAGVFAVVAWLAWLACPTAAFAQSNTISISSVAGDNVVTASEKWNGFKITGHTGNQSNIPVVVTFGTETWNRTSTTLIDGNYWWSVSVPGKSSYITDGDNQTVNAEATFSGGIKLSHSRTFNVDLTLPLVVDAVTGDDVINDGVIHITGDTGDIGSVRINLVIGTGSFINASDLAGEWLHTVLAAQNQSYITGSSASLSVTATKTGYEPSATVSRTLTKDLVHPSVSYTAPLSLQLGVEITPTTSDTDIVSYLFSNPLPGLSLHGVTGVISGTPTTFNASTRRSTVIATDAADNDGTATIDFPRVVAGTLTLNVDDVTGDNTINRSEHRNNFAVTGNTGTDSGVTVTVTIGGTALTSVTSAIAVGATEATWSVTVPANAGYITETSVELSVTATKTGFTSATVTRTLPVDLTPPSVSYTAPSNLTVGVLITPIAPTTSDTDIVSYATSGGSLPLGLELNGNTGIISGSPRTANTNTQTVGVLVTDDAGNVDRPQITFPAVELASGVIVSETELTVPEGGSATYTVRLVTQPTDDVTITVERATGDEDLTASPDTLTFTNSNWSVQQTVTVSAAEDDDGAAGTAQFGHNVISPGTVYHGVSTPGLRATEDDNDTIGVIVSPTALSVPEGGSATYTVRLVTQPTDDVTVEASPDQLSDADLTVTSVTDMDADFNSVTLLFTDLNWHTAQTVTVSAAEDDADEVDGVAIFSHGAAGDEDYYDIYIDPVTATEADNEKVVTVVIQTEVSAPVRGVFEVTIIFSEAVMGFERSEIAVTNGSVTDFSGSAPTYKAEITPSKSGEVIVEVGANVVEYGVGNGNIAGAPLVLEADLYPVVSYQEESYTAREGGETVTVTVKLSEGWDEELAIPIRVTRPQPESTEVDDYTVDGLEEWDAQEGTGKLTFSAGETEQTFTIAANDDEDGEDEELELGFGDLPTAVMAGDPAVATVTLEDKGVVLSYQEESYTALEGGEAATVTVKLSFGWDEELAIPIRVTRLQPESTEVDDYTVDGLEEWDAQEGTGKLTFSAGETEQTFTIAANDDEDGEDEELELGFGDLPTAVMAGDPAVATVTLEDKGVVLSYQEESYTALEGGEAATVTVKLSFGWDEELAIPIRVTRLQPESTEVDDYTVDGLEEWDAQEGTGKLTFSAGETEQTFTIAANDDEDGEDEELELGFGDLPTAVMAGDPAVATVTLEDKGVVLSYQEESYTALEGGEAATVTVKLSFGWDEELAIPIRVTRLQPESTEVDDYTVDGLEEWDAQEGTGKLTFSAGETEQTFTIAANDDEDGEDEELELGFGDLPTAVMAGDPAVATVTLEDKGVVLSYQEESYTALEGGEAATVTVKLSFGWDEELAIPIRVTRLQPESTEVDDYTVDGLEEWDAQEGTGKLTFSAGETEQTFTIAANDDEDGEDEELELGFGDLPTAVMAGDPAVATVTLEDKGVVLSYQEESYTALEGEEAATVTVKLSFGWDEELAIPIRVTRLQPESTEVDDYTVDGLEEWDAQEGTGKLTFSAGETEQTFTIAANDDEDGEDEELELGFGDLPTAVMAGDPAVATVTLEDKGVVELTVSFGQAEYEIREGQEADIEVTVSPATDRRVEVPLVVALQGGATDEDYSGVPASLVFEEGESQGTISLKVLADEVDDPGESIVLSFGELPEAVSEGEISQTTVNFTQQRTAEQFSQTLEVMLAVLARSTAASAQSAIQGRFERHRQWSRLGSSGAMQGSGTNEVVRVDVVEPTQGSWLRSFSLGSLGSAARSGQSYLGASSGYSIGPSGSVDEHDRLQGFGIGDASLGSGLTEYSGMRDQGFNLAGTSFEMALGKQEQGTSTSWVPVLWGQGDLQHFNGDLDRLGMNYRGRLEAAHLGLDLYANDQVLAGLSFMRSWGDMDYTDDGVDGVLGSDLNTFHPYLYWELNERVSMWGFGGIGWGEVDVKELGRTHNFDADFRMLAGGVRSVLCRWPCNELALRADVFTAQLRTDATDDIAKVSGEAHRGRLMLEWVHDLPLAAGRSLSLQLEAGGRFDGGDADRGAGVETGFRLGYLDANHGLDVALHGRTLVVHESDYRDWGLGVQASWDPGEKQRGFRASVMSTWGRDGGGRTTLWDNADAVMRPTGMGAMSMASQYRMESEVAYVGMKAPGVPGLLMPYSRLRWAGPGRELALGTAWSLSAALPAMLELEAMRRETRTGPADLGMSLRVSIPLGGTRDVIPSRGHVSAQAPAPKLIPREVAESGADEQRASAAATQPPAEPVSAPQQDANPPPEPATPESASPASQPAQASAQPQGAAPAPTTTAPAKGHERVVNVQSTPQPRARTTPQPRSAASPTQTGELQAQVTLPQLDLRRQSPPAVTPPDAPAPTVLPSGGILVQVGAFRSAERAARFTDELRQQGHAAITIGGNDYHRVGPFPSRRDGASAQSQLEQQGYQGYLRVDVGHRLESARSLSAAPARPFRPTRGLR